VLLSALPAEIPMTSKLPDALPRLAFWSAPAAGVPKKKPPALAYGAEEKPPVAVIWISAVQHFGVMAIFMVYPLIIARLAGSSADQISNMLQLGMLAMAVGVLLQALPRGPVGSRFLAPPIFTGVYLAPSLLAVKTGGLPLVWGMTIFAGFIEIALSRVWSRLRPFIPPEAAGLVVFLVGVIIGLAALSILLQDNPTGTLTAPDAIVTGCSFAVMAALNIWNRGKLRLFCILIGMAAGYAVAALIGMLTWTDIHGVLDRPLFSIPTLSHLSWSFDWDLFVPFAVTGLAAAMSTTAVVTTYQRLTDADWVRPDMRSISGGVFGDGIAAVVCGLFGTYGMTVSSAHVGLVAATGVASRIIAFAVAALLVLAALQPTLIGVLTIMPRPVMAAAMLFTAVFIMIGGAQIISTRVLDSRRTLVIGMGMMSFVAVSVYPKAFTSAPAWAHPLVTSPLVLATLVALLLNLLFRIGIRRSVSTTLDPANPNAKAIVRFVERSAGTWGARRDVANRLEFAIQQTVEAAVEFADVNGPITVEISFDEFVIEAVIRYVGLPLQFPSAAPSPEELLQAGDAPLRLSGFLIRRHADKVISASSNGVSEIKLHFDH
jgi:NCS2 family nucleobase:cation symporter-2